MKGQRENEDYVDAQNSNKGYTASRSYLSEVMKDKEWENRYRSRKLESTHEPRNDPRMSEKKAGESPKKDKGIFIWHVVPNAPTGRKFVFR